jgi:anti-sigma factor RsiW
VSAHVREKLFDYVSGEMSREEAAPLEEHLARCASCREDLRILREAVDFLPPGGAQPSNERDEQFWLSFPARVAERIAAERRSRTSRIAEAGDRISSFLLFNGTRLIAGSGALAAIALAVVLLRWPAPSGPAPDAAEAVTPAVLQDAPATAKLHDYLKRSRVLLVGVSNMHAESGEAIDLSAERRQSRQLVIEARDLKRNPLDSRSAKLVGDLEKILIELANSSDRQNGPDVEIIRSGIRHHNLLFKIRMTESAIAEATNERTMQ